MKRIINILSALVIALATIVSTAYANCASSHNVIVNQNRMVFSDQQFDLFMGRQGTDNTEPGYIVHIPVGISNPFIPGCEAGQGCEVINSFTTSNTETCASQGHREAGFGGSPGTYSIIVDFIEGGIIAQSIDVIITINHPMPTINLIEPKYAHPGDTIVVRGTHFLDVPSGTGASKLRVWFESPSGGVNWVDAYGVVDWENNQITVVLPKNLQYMTTYNIRIMRDGVSSNIYRYTTGSHTSFFPLVR